MHFQIREGRIEDADKIAEINVAAWKSAYKGIIHQSYLDHNVCFQERAKKWKQNFKIKRDKNYRIFVVLDGQNIIGYADARMARDEDMYNYLELCSIYVHPDYWMKGAGLRLFQTVRQYVIKISYEKLYVWVLVKNIRARIFYERMGAVTVENSVKDIMIGEQSYQEMKYHWVNLNEP